MKVLVACEVSGVVRDAFIRRGHDAWSCDLLGPEDVPEGILPSQEHPEKHIKGDVLTLLNDSWDLMIAHPPCRYLAASGLHWNKRVEGREEKTEEALAFVKKLLNAPFPKIALENPKGCISTRIRMPTQRVQPWQFGEDASKETYFWLKGLPCLQPTNILKKDRYANQTASGQNKEGPSEWRWLKRSVTYKGLAEAMASQWG